MHALWTIPEITAQIVGHMLPLGWDGYLSRPGIIPPAWGHLRPLLHLALTCRDLKEPALDGVWYEIPSLIPLFRLFSNFEAPRSESELGDFRGDISEVDLKHFNTFAYRVRLCSRPSTGIAHSAIAKVCTANQRSFILPRLHRLSTYIVDRAEDIPLFLCPTLDKFEILPPGFGTLSSLEGALLVLAEYGTLTHIDLTATLTSAVFDLATRISSLSTLLLAHVTDRRNGSLVIPGDFLHRLQSLPELRCLSILGLVDYQVSVPFPSGTISLSCLKTLKLDVHSSNMEPLIKAFAAAHFPSLTAIALTIRYQQELLEFDHIPISSSIWTQLCLSLHLCLPSTLSHLKVISHNPISPYLSFDPFLSLIVTFPALSRLHLQGDFFDEVSYEQMRVIVTSLPCLLELTLSTPNTLDSKLLKDIATNLPEILSYLSI